MKAAWQRINLTPAAGERIACFPHAGESRRATGSRDPITATILLLADESDAVAVVCVDWCGIRRDDLTALREQTKSRWQAPQTLHLHVAASHTHSPPDTLYLFGEEPENDYIRIARDQISQGILNLANNLSPVQIAMGQASAPLNHNRRVPGANDKLALEFKPGVTTGATDDQLSVVHFQHADGTAFLLSHYTAHALTLGPRNSQFSADYPGVIRRLLEERCPNISVGFVNGAAGNVHPRHCMRDDDQALIATGKALADAAAELLANLKPLADAPLRPQSKLLQFPNRMDKRLQVDVELAAFQLGQCLVLLVPGEYFVEFQLQLQAQRQEPVLLIGYANGWPGYIPTQASYAEGGYGVAITHKDPPARSRTALPPGAGEQIETELLGWFV